LQPFLLAVHQIIIRNAKSTSRNGEEKVSLKAPLVVLWAVLIAGTTVASESHRLCDLETHTELRRSHEDLKAHNDEDEVLITEEVSETN
jgi:hypothetical protein